MRSLRRPITGIVVALIGIGAVVAILDPYRAHVSVATPALLLLTVVVAANTAGGFVVGLGTALAGFVAFDFFFIPPYNTLNVGAAAGWVALLVYLVVSVVIARLMDRERRARQDARRREQDIRRFHELADRLVTERPLPELLTLVLDTLDQAFAPRWAAVLLPHDGRLVIEATVGQALTAEERQELAPVGGRLQSLGLVHPEHPIRTVALTASSRPVGLLALAADHLSDQDRPLLRAYASQAAQAIERSRLREQVLRSQVLEESERWRRALMAVVSHDLRTPLASMKAAVTTLRDDEGGRALGPHDRQELLALIDNQCDRLDRLVGNTLDMTRIDAGAFTLRRSPSTAADLIEAAVTAVGADVDIGSVEVQMDGDLGLVDVDEVLIVQALANVIENALRLSPPAAPVVVSARQGAGRLEMAVRDRGPGVPVAERDRIFQMFSQHQGGGRAGMGLAIAKTFVEAHGGTITVNNEEDGGACFVITLAIRQAD